MAPEHPPKITQNTPENASMNPEVDHPRSLARARKEEVRGSGGFDPPEATPEVGGYRFASPPTSGVRSGSGRKKAGVDNGALSLIPLDKAVICIWPVSATDQRRRLRILPGPPNEAQRAWLANVGGRATILDPTSKGDAQVFFARVGRHEGWADAGEVRREFGKVDCDLGASMRALSAQLGRAA